MHNKVGLKSRQNIITKDCVIQLNGFARQTYNARESRMSSKAEGPSYAHQAQLHLSNQVYLYAYIVKNTEILTLAPKWSVLTSKNTQLKCVLTLTYNKTNDMLTFKCVPDIRIIKLRQ